MTPPVHHLCEHLLSWKSSSCIPQESCRWEGWCWDRGWRGRSWVLPEEPRSWHRNARCLPGLHCQGIALLHVTGEQAVWHEAALWPTHGLLSSRMSGWMAQCSGPCSSPSSCPTVALLWPVLLDHVSVFVKSLVLKTNAAIKITLFTLLLYQNCASPLDL